MAKKNKSQKMVGYGPWARALAEAFGEDPEMLYDITLHVSPHDAVTVEIKKYVDANATEIIDVIKKVVWVEEDADNN